MKKALLFAIMCMLFAGTAFAQDMLEGQEVARATFATGIEDREPVETITEYYLAEGGLIYFFTELKNMQDTQVQHVWYKSGEEIYRFSTAVKGPRWRTHSRMQAAHFKSGDEVTVEVVGPNSEIYESKTMSIR